MEISVLTPDREIYEGAVSSVKVPGVSGQFEILKNHAPLVSALGEGSVRLKGTSDGELSFSIDKGFVEVLNNKISLLVQGFKE